MLRALVGHNLRIHNSVGTIFNNKNWEAFGRKFLILNALSHKAIITCHHWDGVSNCDTHRHQKKRTTPYQSFDTTLTAVDDNNTTPIAVSIPSRREAAPSDWRHPKFFAYSWSHLSALSALPCTCVILQPCAKVSADICAAMATRT